MNEIPATLQQIEKTVSLDMALPRVLFKKWGTSKGPTKCTGKMQPRRGPCFFSAHAAIVRVQIRVGLVVPAAHVHEKTGLPFLSLEELQPRSAG